VIQDIATLLKAASARFEAVSDSPRLDAEVLLCHALDKPRSFLHAWPEKVPEPEQAERFEALVTARAEGRPVAHLTGRREFWSLELAVTPATLIPRPDTETLVAAALELLPAEGGRLADLGTGSGAIALAIARERPACRVVATDRSPAALAVARDNAARLGLANVEFRQGDWCAPLNDERFALVVSNPPYIPAGDPHLARGDLRFEPPAALASGADGLDDIRRIAACAPRHLEPGGWLLLEHGYDQAAAVTALLGAQGFAELRSWPDLAGHLRVSGGRLVQKTTI